MLKVECQTRQWIFADRKCVQPADDTNPWTGSNSNSVSHSHGPNRWRISTGKRGFRQLHILIPPLRQAMLMTEYGKHGKPCDRPSQGKEIALRERIIALQPLEQTSLPPQGSVLLNSGSDEILPFRRCPLRSS